MSPARGWGLALGLLLLAPAGSGAADTPVAAAAAPFAGVFDGAPVELWSVSLPGRQASGLHTELGGPAIHGRYIYVGAAAADALFVLERHSGRLVRRIDTAAPVQAQPIVADGVLYVADSAGTVSAWAVDPAGEGGLGRAPIWSRGGSAPVLAPVTLHEDAVLVSNVDDVVYGLDRATGELRWRHAHKPDVGRSTRLKLYGAGAPLVVSAEGGAFEAIVGFSDGTLASLDGRTGVVRWQRRVGEGQYPDIIGGGALIGTDVVVAGYSEPLVAVHRASRNVRWRLDVGGAFAPVVAGGQGAAPDLAAAGPNHRFVFHGGSDGVVRCVDGRTGALVWQWDSGTTSSMTRPVPTPAGLLVGAAAGGLALLDAATGAPRWQWAPPFLPSGFAGALAVDGRQAVMVTNAGNIISFVVPEPKPAWVAGDGLFDRTATR